MLTRNKLVRGLRDSSTPDLCDSTPTQTAVAVAAVDAIAIRG